MSSPRTRLAWAAALLAGFGLGVAVTSSRPVTGQNPPEDLPNRGLDANLFMQSSAEYRACCLQAFNLAADRLKQFKDAAKGDRPTAVVLDLDETVFDNAVFQAAQIRSGRGYDPKRWDEWEKSADQIELIPGAKEFVLAAGKLGVVPVYISNRNAKYLATVKAALTRFGLPVADDSLIKLATKTTDKTDRRKEAEQAYAVLMYVGDNLRDFDEAYRFPNLDAAGPGDLDTAIKARKARVDADRAAWGQKWIILPNPAYGEWAKPLGRGREDLDRLVRPGS